MSKISLTCATCGNSFQRYASRRRPGQNAYCSPQCQNAGRQKSVTLQCDCCGTEFEKTPSRVRDTANYCSAECNYAARRIEYGTPPLCACGCGLPVTPALGGKWHKYVHGHSFEGKHHTEETRQRLSEAGLQMSSERRERARGEKNVMWRDGHVKFGLYYTEQKASGFNHHKRRKVRERLIQERGHKCQRCENPDIKLELHHIDHDLFHNTDDNLMLVCHSCNMKFTAEFVKNNPS